MSDGSSNRIRRSYTQSIDAPPEAVFPLLCPVRERDWVKGWHADLIFSRTGLAEPDCIFTTPGDPEDTIWVVTRHDPEALAIEMLMVTPGRTVGKLEIALSGQPGGKTSAEIAYTHTAIGPRGDAFLKTFTKDWYRSKMQTWEAELNHYLKTGVMLAE